MIICRPSAWGWQYHTRTVEVAKDTDLINFIVEDGDSDASAPIFFVRNNGSDFAADDSQIQNCHK